MKEILKVISIKYGIAFHLEVIFHHQVRVVEVPKDDGKNGTRKLGIPMVTSYCTPTILFRDFTLTFAILVEWLTKFWSSASCFLSIVIGVLGAKHHIFRFNNYFLIFSVKINGNLSKNRAAVSFKTE